MSLTSTILSVTRRTKNGFTVGEIFDRVTSRLYKKAVAANVDAAFTFRAPEYSSIRARVYELANSGKLTGHDFRKDTVTGRFATTFVRGN